MIDNHAQRLFNIAYPNADFTLDGHQYYLTQDNKAMLLISREEDFSILDESGEIISYNLDEITNEPELFTVFIELTAILFLEGTKKLRDIFMEE
jgi:hypothetical protein